MHGAGAWLSYDCSGSSREFIEYGSIPQAALKQNGRDSCRTAAHDISSSTFFYDGLDGAR